MRSVINAALFGIPLPLCSCGVIPTAMSLRREGASKGATTSFLIATPQTGVDSIIATYSLMGLPFALVRPLAALVTSILGGAMANLTDNTPGQTSDTMSEEHCHDEHCHDSHCTDEHCQDGHCNISHHEALTSFWGKIKIALRYAYLDMMQDIGKWLVIGLIIAGLITVFVPASAFHLFQGNTWASMLLVLCIAMPMYLCATGSIPVAVALMLKGLTPGAALVLLMAGPACNFASMLVVRKVLGTRSLITYLASIIVGAVVFGWFIDWLQFGGHVDFLQHLNQQHACCTEPDSWFSWLCTILLALLLVNALVLTRFYPKKENNKLIDMNTKVYHIEGMNCNHCRTAAEKALQGVAGVKSATVDLESREAHVTGTATRTELAKAIDEVGFKLTD